MLWGAQGAKLLRFRAKPGISSNILLNNSDNTDTAPPTSVYTTSRRDHRVSVTNLTKSRIFLIDFYGKNHCV